MGNRNNDDGLGIAPIDDGIGKTVDAYMPEIAVERGASIRKLLNERNGSIDLRRVRLSQTDDTGLIEERRLLELERGLRVKQMRDHPRRRRTLAKTSSPGTS